MLQLVHDGVDCCGRWQRVEENGRVVGWRCSGCRSSYADDTAVRFAVLREYDLELQLTRLVREGRQLLGRTDRERGSTRGPGGG